MQIKNGEKNFKYEPVDIQLEEDSCFFKGRPNKEGRRAGGAGRGRPVENMNTKKEKECACGKQLITSHTVITTVIF